METKTVVGSCLIALLAWSLPACAQDSTPTIRTSTQLVTVPVVVKDRSGHVVKGLKVSDFTVAVDNKLQPISQFEEVHPQNANSPIPPQLQPHEYSNIGLPARTEVGMTIILLDLVNTPLLQQTRAREQLIKFLTSKRLPAEQYISILTLSPSGLHQVHDFSNDNDVLIGSLRAVRSELNRANLGLNDVRLPSIDRLPGTGTDSVSSVPGLANAEYREYMVSSQRQLTMEAMVQVAQAFRDVPGRKNLVWTTAGFPFFLYDSLSLSDLRFGSRADFESVWRKLNDANISVYPVDVRGVFDPLWEAQFAPENSSFDTAGAEAARFDFWESKETMRNFADATGGRACLSQNEMPLCYADTLDDAGDYYLLNFYLPPQMRTEGWHKLKVKVAGNYQVRARQGFTVGKKELSPNSNLDVVEALRSPIENTGLPFTVKVGEPHRFDQGRTMLVEKKPKKKRSAHESNVAVAGVPFKIRIAKNALHIDREQNIVFRVSAAAVTDRNEVLALFSKDVQTHLTDEAIRRIGQIEFTFTDAVAVPAGHLLLRFAVLDYVGQQLGTVEAPVEVSAK